MTVLRRVSIEQAQLLIAEQDPLIVDVRDPQSYSMSRIKGAVHLSNDSIGDFLQQTDRQRPLLVYCYHGNSSVGACQFLAEQGFTEVMSMDGGFESWRSHYPVE
jgi:thiosulfate sulfurtransferase